MLVINPDKPLISSFSPASLVCYIKITGFCGLMILFTFQLSPDKLHQFTELEGCGAISHVRLIIYPDGGVSRLRCWGVPAPMSEYSKLWLYKLNWRFNPLGILRFSSREWSAHQVVLTNRVLLVDKGFFTLVSMQKAWKGNLNWLVDRNKFLPREPFWLLPFAFILEINQ